MHEACNNLKYFLLNLTMHVVKEHKRSVFENTSGLQVAHHCFNLRFEVLTVVKTFWEKWSLENQRHTI